MKVQLRDRYYGAAISQIADYPVLSSVHRVGDKEGFYQLNDNKRLLIKYSTAARSPWRFTISSDDADFLDSDINYETWLVLVCGDSSICLLSRDQAEEVIALNVTKSQWISVSFSNGLSMKVAGTLGPATYRIPHSAFPKNVFTAERSVNEFKWPPLCRLRFFGKSQTTYLATEDPFFDLSDSLAQKVGRRPKTVYMGVLTYSPDWAEWTEKNLKRVENTIKYDLNFDLYDVKIERLTQTKHRGGMSGRSPLCSTEFLWKLVISSMP